MALQCLVHSVMILYHFIPCTSSLWLWATNSRILLCVLGVITMIPARFEFTYGKFRGFQNCHPWSLRYGFWATSAKRLLWVSLWAQPLRSSMVQSSPWCVIKVNEMYEKCPKMWKKAMTSPLEWREPFLVVPWHSPWTPFGCTLTSKIDLFASKGPRPRVSFQGPKDSCNATKIRVMQFVVWKIYNNTPRHYYINVLLI